MRINEKEYSDGSECIAAAAPNPPVAICMDMLHATIRELGEAVATLQVELAPVTGDDAPVDPHGSEGPRCPGGSELARSIFSAERDTADILAMVRRITYGLEV